jgi:hypothetical protein
MKEKLEEWRGIVHAIICNRQKSPIENPWPDAPRTMVLCKGGFV